MIFTFHSYDHRTGRSQALANLAELFRLDGLRVAVVDFDFNTPFMSDIFFSQEDTKSKKENGMLDLIFEYKENILKSSLEDIELPVRSLEPYIRNVNTDDKSGSISVIQSGLRTSDYADLSQEIDWFDFFIHWEGGLFFRWFKHQLEKMADIVLVDCPAGENNISRVCFSNLSDSGVILCAGRTRSIRRTLDMIRRLEVNEFSKNNKKSPELVFIPADIGHAESQLYSEFMDQFRSQLGPLSSPLVKEDYLEKYIYECVIPRVSYYIDSDMLAVNKESSISRLSVTRVYQSIHDLMNILMEKNKQLETTGINEFDENLALEKFRCLKMKMSAKPTVFISYAREDADQAQSLYDKLSDAGFMPWLDKKDLLPGQDWQSIIEERIQESDFVIVCLSKKSVIKKGMVQTEMVWALDVVQSLPEGRVYLIPVRFDDCEVPRRLSRLQWVDLFEDGNYQKLELSIRNELKSKIQRLSS
jgi:MinD-like ATPase involved in chromosome partitioning or flagellar assembly